MPFSMYLKIIITPGCLQWRHLRLVRRHFPTYSGSNVLVFVPDSVLLASYIELLVSFIIVSSCSCILFSLLFCWIIWSLVPQPIISSILTVGLGTATTVLVLLLLRSVFAFFPANAANFVDKKAVPHLGRGWGKFTGKKPNKHHQHGL